MYAILTKIHPAKDGMGSYIDYSTVVEDKKELELLEASLKIDGYIKTPFIRSKNDFIYDVIYLSQGGQS